MDLIWLPMAWFIAKREQRFLALACIVSCMAMMRMLSELMDSIHYPQGILGLVSLPVLYRGIILYSLFYALYLILVHYSPRTKGAVFLAASISVFFITSFTFALVMVL